MKHTITSTILAIFILAISLANIVYSENKNPKIIFAESNNEEFIYWQNIVANYPTYRDGYLVLAKMYMEKGNTQAADVLLKQAKLLNPNEEIILPALH